MNLPNKLTIFRIILIPFVLIFLLAELPEFVELWFLDRNISVGMQERRNIALVIFIMASITDALDGYIARKYNLITNFGKFMDPLADKLLVISTLVALIGMEGLVVSLSHIVVILIIAREFLITGFRTLAVEKNIVIAAGNSGKLKTVVQMLMIVMLLINIDNSVFISITKILILLSVILTIYSALEYILKNKNVLEDI